MLCMKLVSNLFNERDTVYGWIYVPACEPKGIVQLIHGFRRTFPPLFPSNCPVDGGRLYRCRR